MKSQSSSHVILDAIPELGSACNSQCPPLSNVSCIACNAPAPLGASILQISLPYEAGLEHHLSLQAKVCPGVPVMALTATATSKVIKDILESLKIQRCRQFQVQA